MSMEALTMNAVVVRSRAPEKTGQLILRCCRGYMEGLFRAVPLQSHVATYPLVRTLSCPARQVVGSQELAGAS